MDQLEEKVRNILFEIGKDIKIHKLIDGNLIIDIDYEKYVKQILKIINQSDS